jgi:hypothetical protein
MKEKKKTQPLGADRTEAGSQERMITLRTLPMPIDSATAGGQEKGGRETRALVEVVREASRAVEELKSGWKITNPGHYLTGGG